MKRWITLLLIFALLVSVFAGCKKEAPPQDSVVSTTDGNSSSVGTKPLDEEDEVFHYTIAPYLTGPIGDDMIMPTYWEELLGATFELIYLESDQYMQLLNLRVASGDTPDVMMLEDQSYVQYRDDGIIGGFTQEFLQEASPVTYDFIMQEFGEEGFDFVSTNGLMYSLPGGRHHNQFTSPVIWNVSWLNAVGIDEIPKTLEETTKALYAFRNDDPDGNGQKDTYGLSESSLPSIYGAFGFLRNNWQDDGEGNLVFDVAHPNGKEALELLSTWYQDEIIDPEFITGENKGGYWANSNAFCEGVIGYTGIASYYHWRPQEMEEKGLPLIGNAELIKTLNPDLDYQFGFPPVGPYGDAGTFRPPYLVRGSNFSTSLVENEPKFAKFIQMTEHWCGLHDIEEAIVQSFGIKGEHWDYDENQTPVQRPEFSAIETLSEMGANVTFQYYENPQVQAALAPVQYEWVSELYAEPGRNEYYENAITEPLDSAADYFAEAKKVLDEGVVAIITGDKPVDYYDEMIEKFYSAGGEILTAEANERYRNQ